MLQCSALHSVGLGVWIKRWIGKAVVDREAGEGATAASQYPALGALDQRPLLSKAESPRHRQGLVREALAAVWRLWLSAEAWKPWYGKSSPPLHGSPLLLGGLWTSHLTVPG